MSRPQTSVLLLWNNSFEVIFFPSILRISNIPRDGPLTTALGDSSLSSPPGTALFSVAVWVETLV
ncbi:11827_t:CDS:2 [Diversispora eburnea]|uniref:11827_t:CDS:1 n=1 Tax=Diversispora eburnea TaxID=1213867 RepID=A0A9N8Z883_9GLOM|nr:11827_t:CDS:2 [Diversispora eburnea]